MAFRALGTGCRLCIQRPALLTRSCAMAHGMLSEPSFTAAVCIMMRILPVTTAGMPCCHAAACAPRWHACVRNALHAFPA